MLKKGTQTDCTALSDHEFSLESAGSHSPPAAGCLVSATDCLFHVLKRLLNKLTTIDYAALSVRLSIKKRKKKRDLQQRTQTHSATEQIPAMLRFTDLTGSCEPAEKVCSRTKEPKRDKKKKCDSRTWLSAGEEHRYGGGGGVKEPVTEHVWVRVLRTSIAWGADTIYSIT